MYKSFTYLENNVVKYTDSLVKDISITLKPGIYHIAHNHDWHNPDLVLKQSDDKETVKSFTFSDKEKLTKLIDAFFDKDKVEKIKNLGYNHKAGILLSGREGTGKTSIIKEYTNKIATKHQGLVFIIDEHSDKLIDCWSFIENIRKGQSNPIVIVFDEFEQYLGDGNEALIKSILDGNRSIDDCLFFAATNYLEKIPKPLSNRPSRFKYSFIIEGMQNTDEILNILSNILINNTNLEEIAKNLKGKTIDEIKQFCLDKILDLETMEFNQQIGFKK